MRVTHVITRLIVGGAQENTVASVLGLAPKLAGQVHLVFGTETGPEGSLEPVLAATPQLFTRLPELVRPIHPWKDALALHRLIRLFRQQRPDIVHTHSGKAGILGRLAAYRAGVPIIIHTIHGPSFGSFQGPVANTVFRAAERFSARFTSYFVTVARAMTAQYLAAGIGRPDQYACIYSGFDLAPFQSAENDPAWRRRWGIDREDFVVGMIARLFKLKGHDDLLAVAPELVRQCPRIKFLWVGDGPWRGRFEDRIRALGLEQHFVFAGLVRPIEVPRWVGIMDVLVHLSRREGLPRALPQALAAARPVIAYDCDGAGEVCFNNETGFLLPPGDLRGLSQRLCQLEHDPALRARLGRRGQEWVCRLFPVEKMVDDLYALYLKLSANQNRSGSPD